MTAVERQDLASVPPHVSPTSFDLVQSLVTYCFLFSGFFLSFV